jgi:hypothetical protein
VLLSSPTMADKAEKPKKKVVGTKAGEKKEKKEKKDKDKDKEKKEKDKGKPQTRVRRKRKIDLISADKDGTKSVMLLEGCGGDVKQHFDWSDANLLGTGAFAKVGSP